MIAETSKKPPAGFCGPWPKSCRQEQYLSGITFNLNVRAKKAASIRRADLFASLDRLAEVGQRLDGPYRLGAAYIRGQLKAGAATRLKRRAEMILELRFRWHAHQSNNEAPREIQKAVTTAMPEFGLAHPPTGSRPSMWCNFRV